MVFQNIILIYLISIICDHVDFIYMYVLINIGCKYAYDCLILLIITE